MTMFYNKLILTKDYGVTFTTGHNIIEYLLCKIRVFIKSSLQMTVNDADFVLMIPS